MRIFLQVGKLEAPFLHNHRSPKLREGAETIASACD
jgi:hypothetical protein